MNIPTKNTKISLLSLAITFIIYIGARYIQQIAYEADMTPVSLLAQLLAFSSLIYFIVLIFKFIFSFFKPAKISNNSTTPNAILENTANSTPPENQTVTKNVLSLGTLFILIVVGAIALVFFAFLMIGLGGGDK